MLIQVYSILTGRFHVICMWLKILNYHLFAFTNQCGYVYIMVLQCGCSFEIAGLYQASAVHTCCKLKALKTNVAALLQHFTGSGHVAHEDTREFWQLCLSSLNQKRAG